MIAALYVIRGGVYCGLPGVDPWDEARDARLYAGPHAVVAHPPCARWSRLAGLVEWRGGARRGDDGGTFAAALAAVRAYGGVLEHPAASAAWAAHGLIAPPTSGGWVSAGDWRGWTCCIEQGHYGHRARKPTWLYAVGCELPVLRWGRSTARAQISGLSTERAQRLGTAKPTEFLSLRQRISTPPAFRDVLLTMARSVDTRRRAA